MYIKEKHKIYCARIFMVRNLGHGFMSDVIFMMPSKKRMDVFNLVNAAHKKHEVPPSPM
jgi:hypothetical protein